MSIIINPVKSVLKECENTENQCGIHKMNDMCYGICSDYENTPECLQSCRNFIVNNRNCQDGYKCPSKIVPRAPPIFNDVNDNFTPYLKELGVQGALEKCNAICEKRSPRIYECKQKCRLNANAIEEYKQNKLQDIKEEPKNIRDNWWYYPVLILSVMALISAVFGALYIAGKKRV
jgi:hypothetical protein